MIPQADELYPMGTLGQVVQMLKLPDGTVKVLVEGKLRARTLHLEYGEECIFATLEVLPDEEALSSEQTALIRSVNATFENYAGLSKKIPPEMVTTIAAIEEAGRFADTVAAHLNVQIADKQKILEDIDPLRRLEGLLALMEREVEILQIEKKIRNRVKSQMERSQKEYYLNEQMRAIQKELGEKDEFKQEMRELEEQIKKARDVEGGHGEGPGRAAQAEDDVAHVRRGDRGAQLHRLAGLAAVEQGNQDRLDLDRAEEILEADHYGLEKVKERILEYLAVQALVKKIKGPILCLVGPPGVGKTSLGRSIARSMGRKFVRVSLGGVRDEAEIRGHRRTYIGAMPGKVIQGLRKVGVRNPVFLLDEVDKMSTDFRGDPSSALLEVLDPEQNHTLRRSFSRCRLRPVVGHVHRHRQHPAFDPRAVAGPHGGDPHRGVHRGGKAAYRRALPAPQADSDPWLEGRAGPFQRSGPARDPAPLHPRGRGAQPRTGTCHDLSQDCP